MDIVYFLDKSDGKSVILGDIKPRIKDWLGKNGSICTKQTLPRFTLSSFPEYGTPSAKAYYTRKKEEMMRSFDLLLKQSPALIKELNTALKELEPLIQSPDTCNGRLSEDDFHLFASLHNLSIVAGLQFPAKVEQYRQTMSQKTNIALSDPL